MTRVLVPDAARDELWRGVQQAETARKHGRPIIRRDEERYNWRAIAREKQLPPEGRWLVWMLRTGRQWGKTRTGAEWVREQIEVVGREHIAFISDTAYDVRDVMIEHPKSGILAISPPWNRPLYEPSKRRLTWPNGSRATGYSAEDPDQLRGPQHDAAWCDEVAKWKRQRETWDNMMLGLTLGADPRVIVTTTPRPTPLIKELSKRPDVIVTRGHTRENLKNLAPHVQKEIIDRYEGTRLGRQELAGELLEDVEGALWQQTRLEELRVTQADVPDLHRIVVAIDPSGSTDEDASEQGIVVAGIGACRCSGRPHPETHGFLLQDLSGHYSPNEWARRAVAAYKHHRADRIIAETNYGGDMVKSTIRTVDQSVAYKAVHATRGKQVRAEPIAAMSERKQGIIHHVGPFLELEEQLCNWVPGMKANDRLDAYVWAFTELLAIREPPPRIGPIQVWPDI